MLLLGKKRSILSQYDEEKKSAPKLVLGDQGVAVEIKKKSGNINFDDDDDNITIGAKVPQSLKVEMQEAKDFYTSTGIVTIITNTLAIIIIIRIRPISKAEEKEAKN